MHWPRIRSRCRLEASVEATCAIVDPWIIAQDDDDLLGCWVAGLLGMVRGRGGRRLVVAASSCETSLQVRYEWMLVSLFASLRHLSLIFLNTVR